MSESFLNYHGTDSHTHLVGHILTPRNRPLQLAPYRDQACQNLLCIHIARRVREGDDGAEDGANLGTGGGEGAALEAADGGRGREEGEDAEKGQQ